MAYRVTFDLDAAAIARLSQMGDKLEQVVQPIMTDGLNLLKQYAVQNLSGVPFTSDTGTWTINKRTGKGAASVQVQYPYGSPFRGRVFAYAGTRYADNPEEWNYLKILEEGRGEVVPKYTPSAKAGMTSRARLTIPGGPHGLAFGVNGFRGATGRYRFVSKLKPMPGRGWMQAAAASTQAEMQDSVVNPHLQNL